jgi:hypothetical protein
MAKEVVFKGTAAIGIFLLIIALWLVFAGLQAWIVMLLVGALSSYLDAVPALGFWPVFFIVCLLNVVAGIFRGGSVSKS